MKQTAITEVSTTQGVNSSSPKPDNMRHWNALCVTDPKATKPFTRKGGFRGTAIKPHWCIRQATEHFGPIGIGWGFTELDHVLEGGMIFCKVSLWYIDPVTGQKAEGIEQWGGTETGVGGKLDDESFKKSLTDGLVKCLSYVGIAADVHLGQFDDSKYVQEADAEYRAAERAAEPAPAKTAEIDGDRNWTKTVVDYVNGLTVYEHAAAYKDQITGTPEWKALKERSPAMAQEIVTAFQQAKARLAPKAA